MDIIEKFGNMVGNEALKDPVKARPPTLMVSLGWAALTKLV